MTHISFALHEKEKKYGLQTWVWIDRGKETILSNTQYVSSQRDHRKAMMFLSERITSNSKEPSTLVFWLRLKTVGQAIEKR